MKHMFKNILFHKKSKHDKNDAIKKAFSLFSVPSNENERIINFWPLKFKEKDEEALYIIKLCDNMYNKKNVILISHLISLLLMYSTCLIVGNMNDLFSVLKLTYILLHTFTAINIILILILHATHYVEMFKSIKGGIFIFYIMMIFSIWCSWLFILFNDIKDLLPVVVNVNNFLYATYANNKINIVLYFFAYLPIFYLITIIPCSIFMIISALVGSLFIFIIRYIIEIQRRLSFHSWNKQTKQIIKLKKTLREEKQKLSTTNIEEIYNLINDSIGNYYNENKTQKETNWSIVNNLEKILNILKEDNLFSPDLKTINKKSYNHIYGYIMDLKKHKEIINDKTESKEDRETESESYCAEECPDESKEGSQIESILESISDVKPKRKSDLAYASSYEEKGNKILKYDFNMNMDKEIIDIDTWNTKFLDRKTPNSDEFIKIGYILLNKYYTSNQNIPVKTLYSMLYEMKKGYNDVPYHNSIHAAMVTKHCSILITSLDTVNILKDNEMAAFLISALGHDIGHFGRTNMFLKNCSNFLSIIYNNKSILENYHCSYLFSILSKEEHNIFKNEDLKILTNLRQQIIEVILATDMSKHIKILAQFRIKSIKIKSYIEKNIVLCLKMIIKAADLSHNCVDWSEHYLWVKRLVNEFYLEGDDLLERGVELNPLFDRKAHNNFIQIQKTFLRELVLPLVSSLKTLDTSTITQLMLNQVKRNYSKWAKIEKDETKKTKYLNELLADVPNSWKNAYMPNFSIYKL
ncbi:phosphodiesterase gamma, putative [Plasmodium vinckei brucechwatti]|uniref:Phosphodiesterase n=1 Tax=Plasmodium vinckei brucechwatti TaxID=119398 RepID=A0A6V7T0H6_PLAVN|nr:phosphodiesterase gamma, putative [Plasmodium vinckei brucechwatti]